LQKLEGESEDFGSSWLQPWHSTIEV